MMRRFLCKKGKPPFHTGSINSLLLSRDKAFLAECPKLGSAQLPVPATRVSLIFVVSLCISVVSL